MSYTEILYEVKDRILTITLHRPDRMNAFTAVMMKELIDAFERADKDDDVRVVIVTGHGKAFCAGADLGSGGATFDYRGRSGEEAMLKHRDGGGLVSLKIFEIRKPVIAAINGPAVGVGLTMTLPMDIRVAAAGTKLGFVFTRRGIVPEACSTWFLPRIVGVNKAQEWFLTGRIFAPEEGLEAGLINHVVPADQVLSRAREIAAEIAENTSGVSVALARQMLWRGLVADHPMAAHKAESMGIYTMGQSADAAEGVKSFLEKRPPKFPMSPTKDIPPFYPWWTEPPFPERAD